MRGVGGEAGLAGKSGFESGKGFVKDGGQVAKFAAGRLNVDAIAQVSGGDALGRFHNACDGA